MSRRLTDEIKHRRFWLSRIIKDIQYDLAKSKGYEEKNEKEKL